MHSDNLQNWILWRDKLFCNFLLFSTTYIALNANSLTFPWLFPIFIFFPDLQQNSLTFPWLLPSLEFPWLFPDRWTPCWSHRFGPTLVQLMACCLSATSHYHQAIINVDVSSKVFSEIHLRSISLSLIHNRCVEITLLKLLPHLTAANKILRKPSCTMLYIHPSVYTT